MAFSLDERLAQDGVTLGRFALCRVILVNNRLYPWLILVPEVEGMKEIIDLPEEYRLALLKEISFTSEVMQQVYDPDKLNIAALGNVVAQLHIHVIARYQTDDAWPDPVWGKGREPYSQTGWQEALDVLTTHLGKIREFTPETGVSTVYHHRMDDV